MDALTQGHLLAAQGRPAEAERHFRAVLDDAAATVDQRTWARFDLGSCLAEQGRLGEARHEYAALREDARTGRIALPEHVLLHQLGMVERLAGRWAAALACFEEERAMIAARGDDALAVAVNACELGIVALHLGEAAGAWAHLRRSLDAATRTTDLIAVGCARRGLGEWHARHGTADDATREWEAAAQSFTAAGDARAVEDVRQRSVTGSVTGDGPPGGPDR